jgi:hypothetical protein
MEWFAVARNPETAPAQSMKLGDDPTVILDRKQIFDQRTVLAAIAVEAKVAMQMTGWANLKPQLQKLALTSCLFGSCGRGTQGACDNGHASSQEGTRRFFLTEKTYLVKAKNLDEKP